MAARPLTIVRAVTQEHARTFAESWIERSFAVGAIGDAFHDPDLMKWNFYNRAVQERILDIEAEICAEITEAVRPAIVEAFLEVARRVLARERRAQRKRAGKRR